MTGGEPELIDRRSTEVDEVAVGPGGKPAL